MFRQCLEEGGTVCPQPDRAFLGAGMVSGRLALSALQAGPGVGAPGDGGGLAQRAALEIIWTIKGNFGLTRVGSLVSAWKS